MIRPRPLVPLLAAVLVTLSTAPLAAQISAAEYAARRDTTAAHLGDAVLLAFGATAPATDEGHFRQLPSFMYLTGYTRPDAAFLMVVRDGRVVHQMLYEPATDPRMALYNGFRPDSAELARRTGLGLAQLAELRPLLDSMGLGGPLFFVTDVHTRDAAQDDSLTRGRRFVGDFWDSHPQVTVRSADPLLDSLRVRKSPAEIALLRKAVAISADGERAAMRRVRPGVNERDILALTDYTFRMAGGSGPSFRAIIGSGPNSTSYHYRDNDRVMRAGEVVVMDMGALYENYAGDVTRTVPVSGRFTPEQAVIYRTVRAAQAAAERLARPGAPVAAGDSAVRAVQARELAKLGLIESPEATFDPPWADSATCARLPAPLACKQVFLYQAHGLGHGIGLEVHDAGGYSYSPTGFFQEGEVFTIEPGIYVSTALLEMLPDTPKNRAFIARVRPAVERYTHIGVRIEDDYLVRATGAEWLSRAPRELEEIEAAMRAGSPAAAGR
jgi:Xaa-Pro aminopeptidase